MQFQSWTAQAPEVILWSVQRGTPVNSYPAHKQIGIVDSHLHSLITRPVEVQNIQTHRRDRQNNASQTPEQEYAHGLSIEEAH